MDHFSQSERMRVEILRSLREKGGFLSFKFSKITIMHKCVVLIQEPINRGIVTVT